MTSEQLVGLPMAGASARAHGLMGHQNRVLTAGADHIAAVEDRLALVGALKKFERETDDASREGTLMDYVGSLSHLAGRG